MTSRPRLVASCGMKPLIFACLIASSPLAAQSAADSAAIRKAAIGRDSAGVRFMDIVGDTAIVVGAIVRVTVDTTKNKDGSVEIMTANSFDDFEARVERRRGAWVRISRRVEKSQ